MKPNPMRSVRGRSIDQTVDTAELFTEAVETAVEETLKEAGDGRTTGSAPSTKLPLSNSSQTEALKSRLRALADENREFLLAGEEFAREFRAFRQAAAYVPVTGTPMLRVLRWADLLLCLLSLPVVCLLYAWTIGNRLVPSPSSVGIAGAALGVLLAMGVVVFTLTRLVAPQGDAGWPPYTALFAAAAVIGLVTTVELGYVTYVTTADWVVPGLLLPVTGGAWLLAFTPRFRTWWPSKVNPRADRRSRERRDVLHRQCLQRLVEEIQQLLRPQMTAAAQRSHSTHLSVEGTLSLKRVHGAHYVDTPAKRRLVAMSEGMDDGSIALSGPRGVGKTELLRAFSAEGERLGVLVEAPVLYDRRDFALHLFAKVCERVLEAGPRSLRRQAGQQLRQITYLQTRGKEIGFSLWGLAARISGSRTRQPLTYPEIVSKLRDFLRLTAVALAADHKRLVVGIDELDRIRPAAAAQDFLNEIKVIFDVPGCLFVLSVSDEALRAADLASVGRRDAFDSAIDEVVRVEPLNQENASRLLASRVIGLPEAFTALFNALAGGIPRDLLRVARAAILFDAPSENEDLAVIARRLVRREVSRIMSSVDNLIAPDGPWFVHDKMTIEYGTLRELGESVTEEGPAIANRLFLLDTVLGVFARGLTPDVIEEALQDGRFTDLARASSRIGYADRQARAALQSIRREWNLDPLPPSP